MPSTHPVSRRTVARGVAWSVPVVAVSVAAPAMAFSYHAPSGGSPIGCKCPGGGSPYLYNFTVTFTTPGPDNYSFVVDSFLVDNAAPTEIVAPIGTVTLTGGEGVVPFRFRSTNSNSTHTVQIKYTPTNTTTGQVGTQVTLTLTDVKFNPCKASDSYAACP